MVLALSKCYYQQRCRNMLEWIIRTGSYQECMKLLDIELLPCRTAPGFNVLCTWQRKILHKYSVELPPAVYVLCIEQAEWTTWCPNALLAGTRYGWTFFIPFGLPAEHVSGVQNYLSILVGRDSESMDCEDPLKCTNIIINKQGYWTTSSLMSFATKPLNQLCLWGCW